LVIKLETVSPTGFVLVLYKKLTHIYWRIKCLKK